MSQSTGIHDKTLKAGANLSAKQYYIVKMCSATTPYGVILGAAVTDKLLGVLQNEPAMNEEAVVRVEGTTKVLATATVVIGDWVTVYTDGMATPSAVDKDVIIGLALESSAAAGDVIEILLTHFTNSK